MEHGTNSAQPIVTAVWMHGKKHWLTNLWSGTLHEFVNEFISREESEMGWGLIGYLTKNVSCV